jgi:hypothetical protein
VEYKSLDNHIDRSSIPGGRLKITDPFFCQLLPI